MSKLFTEAPTQSPQTFLNFPLINDFEGFAADIAILGVPFGAPYSVDGMANDQSLAPDHIRNWSTLTEIGMTLDNYDFDLGGTLLDGQDIRVVDCGNATASLEDPGAHYANAERAAREIFAANTVLITLGGDHGVPIPIMKALEVLGTDITLVHIDAHLDWRDEINGVKEGYSSVIRRAAELPYIKSIHQIGMRGIGSAKNQEVKDAIAHGCAITTAYQMHDVGMAEVLKTIPDGGTYYLTIDADGIDPSIMPAVLAQTPGGLNWVQLHKLIHGLVNKGRVVGMDLVEITPSTDVGNISMIHAERLLCNFIGATVRAGYYD
ncbi:agmatinase [Aestuariirhabdus sp. Z084]|uniref:agmatinase n=1 Tax=Aestuariirhabdus haliotis TaxID=2918751 RepID=UPI00201B3D9A|nr:agmatinase [Aestuariirhabdus haliotis]MCL6417707.1 agmatinase [Aestuariirhabdus haliotis]MCL6421636.1 agmatinase [Aestuariirhabdus haliotis]